MNSFKPICKAVIPVAGMGTRMLPATKAIPKELLPVYDRPIIEHVVNEAVNSGIHEIIFVTRSGKEAIENHFDVHFELEHRLIKKGHDKILEDIVNIIPNNVKISSVRQPDALGLGHAILCAKHLINNEPFAVLLPDVLIIDKQARKKNFSFGELIKAWNKMGIGQVMVEQVSPENIENYGVVDTDKKIAPFQTFPLKGLIEKPKFLEAPSNLAIVGRYVLPPQILDLLDRTIPGVGGEIQLTDAMSVLLENEGLNAIKTDANIYDCGNKLGYLCANLEIGMRDPNSRENIIKTFYNLMSGDI